MLSDTFGDEPATFIMKLGFISENITLKNNKYNDLCKYYSAFSEGMLFRFMCCPIDMVISLK